MDDARVIRNRKPAAARYVIEAETKARGFRNYWQRSSGFQEPQLVSNRVFRNDFRVFRNDFRVFRNRKAGYQEHQPSGYQEPSFRVFRNSSPRKAANPHTNPAARDTLTRARDLNRSI